MELNLVLCRSVDNFEVILASERVRGYIVGFFDGAAQAAGVEFSSDKQFFTYLGLGHELVLQKDLDDPITFAMESIALQGSEAFSEGQILGGTDYFNWMSDRQQQPSSTTIWAIQTLCSLTETHRFSADVLIELSLFNSGFPPMVRSVPRASAVFLIASPLDTDLSEGAAKRG